MFQITPTLKYRVDDYSRTFVYENSLRQSLHKNIWKKATQCVKCDPDKVSDLLLFNVKVSVTKLQVPTMDQSSDTAVLAGIQLIVTH